MAKRKKKKTAKQEPKITIRVAGIKDLIDSCPRVERGSDKSGDEIQLAHKRWCENVALWTQRLCDDKACGLEVRRLMNLSIQALGPKSRFRAAHAICVSLLTEGYKKIAKMAPDKEVEGWVLWEVHLDRMAGRLFAEEAVRSLQSELQDPSKNIRLGAVRRGTAGGFDPFLKPQVDLLQDARDDLLKHMAHAGMDMSDAMDVYVHSYDSGDWAATRSDLDTIVYTLSLEAAPWTWLGVNVVGYGYSERSVIRFPHPQVQQAIASTVNPDQAGPSLRFAEAIRDALQVIRKKHPYRQKGTKGRTRNKGELEELVADILRPYDTPDKAEDGPTAAAIAKRLRISRQAVGKTVAWTKYSEIRGSRKKEPF